MGTKKVRRISDQRAPQSAQNLTNVQGLHERASGLALLVWCPESIARIVAQRDAQVVPVLIRCRRESGRGSKGRDGKIHPSVLVKINRLLPMIGAWVVQAVRRSRGRHEGQHQTHTQRPVGTTRAGLPRVQYVRSTCTRDTNQPALRAAKQGAPQVGFAYVYVLQVVLFGQVEVEVEVLRVDRSTRR